MFPLSFTVAIPKALIPCVLTVIKYVLLLLKVVVRATFLLAYLAIGRFVLLIVLVAICL